MGSHDLTERSTTVPTLRTTNQPEKELEVSDAEAVHLGRLGLVLDTKATTDEGARRAAVRHQNKENEQ